MDCEIGVTPYNTQQWNSYEGTQRHLVNVKRLSMKYKINPEQKVSWGQNRSYAPLPCHGKIPLNRISQNLSV